MSTTPSDEISNRVAVDATPLPDAPYRGIAPFRFIDQQIFAAREDEIWALVSNVTLYRAVLLYGESGTGKSSLINAGLLPQALAENYVPDRLRVQPLPGREIKVERIRTSDSQGEPAYLPSNFAASEGHVSGESIELSLAAFRERIEQFRAVSNAEPADAPFGETNSAPLPLLIFDQFEEFVTLFEQAQRSDAQKAAASAGTPVGDTQQQLLKMFVELIRDQNLPVKIVFSFREDYLAKLSLLFDFCPELQDQAQRLLPPHVKTLPQIIRAPFKDAALIENFRQHSGGRSELTKELAQKISDELSRRSENDRANLTELQIVCQRLWEAPDPEALFAKGIEGILDSYGDDVIDDFTPERRAAAIVLLSHLITGSDTRNIISQEDLIKGAQRTLSDGEANRVEVVTHRARAAAAGRTLNDGEAERELSKALLSKALEDLCNSQIVRRERRRDIYFYEITSEYLVPWIKKRVAARTSEVERDRALKAQKELEAQQLETEAKFRKEQRRARVFQRVLAALIVVLIVAVGLGIFGWIQYRRAKVAEEKAKTAKNLTDRILNAVKLINSQNEKEALEGVTEVDKLINEKEKDKQIPPGMERALLAPGLASDNLEVKKAALKVLIYFAPNDSELAKLAAETIDKDPALKQSLSGDAADNFQNLTKTIAPRVYIHISDESQRETAQKLAAALTQTKRYLVPGIDNVGNRAPIANELRFFQQNDPTVKEIMAILDQTAGEKWVEKFTPGYENSEKIRPGHFEMWFAGGNWLRAWPVDEQGNYIPKLRMTYVITDSKGKSITRHTTYTSLPPGDYKLRATFEGYEPVTTQFTIERGKETKIKLPVTKR